MIIDIIIPIISSIEMAGMQERMPEEQLELMESKVFPDYQIDDYLRTKMAAIEKQGGNKSGSNVVNKLNRTFVTGTIYSEEDDEEPDDEVEEREEGVAEPTGLGGELTPKGIIRNLKKILFSYDEKSSLYNMNKTFHQR